MIDEEAFNRLNVMETHYAKQALVLLNRSGVFLNQLNVEHEKLLAGPEDEVPIHMAHRVLKYRQVVNQLRTLTELAVQFEKESNDA